MGTSALTPYRILHVSTDADDAKLHVAFRRHIHALQRGRLSDEQFRLVCRAYECLTDHEQRTVFDATEKWVHELSLTEYTLQQLANERILCSTLRIALLGALPEEINAQDPGSGYTLLYCAVRAGNDQAVEIAIDRGADLDSIQRDGSTALHAASFYGHSSAVYSLLWNGADFSIRNNYGKRAAKQALNRRIKQVFTELKKSPFVQVAAKRLSWLKTHRYEFAAYINYRYYRCYHTLLHCASKKGFLEIVCWLVEQCSADLDIVDLKGNSALHLATAHGHRPVVEYLLDRGASPHLLNHEDLTAQQIAQRSNIGISHRCFVGSTTRVCSTWQRPVSPRGLNIISGRTLRTLAMNTAPLCSTLPVDTAKCLLRDGC